MSIITPSDTALAYLSQCTFGQQRFDLTEQSDTTGHVATRLGGPPRWLASLRTLDAMEPAIGALWKALALQLRGRVNHLAIYDVTQPQPRGTARGTILMASTAAAGATSISLSGVRGTNYVLGGSFEVDTNADGIADGWARFSGGTTGSLSASLSGTAVAHGTYSQSLVAAGLGGTSADRNGIQQAAIPATHLAGSNVTLAASMAGTLGTTLVLAVSWKDSGGSTIAGADLAATTTANGAAQAISVTGACPSNAATATVFAYQHTGSGSATLLVDAVQLVLGASAGAYPDAPTLLVADALQLGTGVGSHYCLVTADAQATDAGAVTITIEPPTRQAISSGTAVAWEKPLCHFKVRPDSQSWSGVAGGTGVGGFAFDLMEDWSA